MKNSIFILSAMFILGACSSESAKKAYNDSFRKTFIKEGIKSCIENSGLKESEAREYCECAMNKLNESLSNDEIVDISMDNSPKDLDDRIEKAISSCIGE
jgi:lipoprotein